MLFCIGIVGGLVSGLLGIGGGILLAPMLLYIPPLAGSLPLDMRTVSGLTMVQSLAASLSAARVHQRFRYVSRGLVLQLGVPLAISSFAGAWLSRGVDPKVLLALFAVMAVVAAIMMFVPKPSADVDVPVDQVTVNRWMAAACAIGLGLLGGLVGQSGSFLLFPIMIY